MNKIIEENKAIAKFMGGKFYQKEKGDSTTLAWHFPDESMPPHFTSIYIYDEDLQYYSDWSWLMPVIEKIESKGYCFFIGTNAAYISDKKGEVIIHCNNFENKIQTVYGAAACFVNYLNYIKPKKHKCGANLEAKELFYGHCLACGEEIK
jgi:hypothetical protein